MYSELLVEFTEICDRVSVVYDNLKFKALTTYHFAKWHVSNMFEVDFTDHFKEECAKFDYHKITFKADVKKLYYRISCWREWKLALWFYVNHLEDLGVASQQIVVLSKEKGVRDGDTGSGHRRSYRPILG